MNARQVPKTHKTNTTNGCAQLLIALELCHNFVRLHLSDMLSPWVGEVLLLDFCARVQMKFFEEDLEVNQT